jgi:ribosomal protein S18 acetylase RimI-like enzyme
MEIQVKQATSAAELLEIIALQEKNHRDYVSIEEGLKNGFVSVKHELTLLEEMNIASPQIIATADKEVIAFALVMLKAFEGRIPVLVPMFKMLKQLYYNHKKLEEYSYYVMGQICIAEKYRSIGLFDKLYLKHKEMNSKKYELCVTEVSSSNFRSLKAHQRVGFKTIHTFKDFTDEWQIMVWDWNN